MVSWDMPDAPDWRGSTVNTFTAENSFLKDTINSALRKRCRFNIQMNIFDLVLGYFYNFVIKPLDKL
jgi:hypothetical protein